MNEDVKCKLVLTYEMCDGDVMGCLGVFDDPLKCLGKIMSSALDEMDRRGEDLTDDSFTMKWYHDDNCDNYYQLEVTYKDRTEDSPDIYRVYYLREEDEKNAKLV